MAIQQYSDDPDVAEAAVRACEIIRGVLQGLPEAQDYDYGGHVLKLGDYGVCSVCTKSVAEAQQAQLALEKAAEPIEDEEVRTDIQLAASVFELEAKTALMRAELHNGRQTEPIVNEILGFVYNRTIHDSFGHNHEGSDN